MTCLFHNEWIFCGSSLFNNPPNLCSLQHKQAINQQGCSCQDEGCPAHSFAGIVIPVCMSEIERGSYWHMCCLNIAKAKVHFSHVIGSVGGEKSMYWLCLIMAFGCLISVETCFTTSIGGDEVVIWKFENVDSRSLKQQGEIQQGETLFIGQWKVKLRGKDKVYLYRLICILLNPFFQKTVAPHSASSRFTKSRTVRLLYLKRRAPTLLGHVFTFLCTRDKAPSGLINTVKDLKKEKQHLVCNISILS